MREFDMNLMKYNIVIVLTAFFIISSTAADEAKSSSKQQQQQIQQSQNNVPLSSSVNDAKQQNKRLAYFAPSSTLSSGFKPITPNNFIPNNHYSHQPYASGQSSSYVKYSSPHQQQQFVSPLNVKFSSPPSSYHRGASLSYGYNNNNNNQQLTFAASQPAAVSYLHSPYQLAQQIFSQQLPLHNYNVQQLAPIIHAPTMGIFSAYQGPQSQHFASYNKYPQIPAFTQPQTYNIVPQQAKKNSQIITSKPIALETSHPAASSSSSGSSSSPSNEILHNHHGGVSYSTFLQPSEKLNSQFHYAQLPTASSSIATSPHVYYHHHHHQPQPQTFVDFSKHLSDAYTLPFATNYYGGFKSAAHVSTSQPPASEIQPYAHISKISVIPTSSAPLPQVVSVSVVPTIPQKISLH